MKLLDDRAGLIIAAKKDRRVFRLEGIHAGKGRTIRIEHEAAGKLGGDRVKPLLNPIEGARVPIDKIYRLDLGQDVALAEWCTDHRQDNLS